MNRLRAALRSRQRGVALLVVLFATALVTVVVVTLMTRQRGVLLRTQQFSATAQARAYALGAESYAREVLAADMRGDPTPPQVDTLRERWAQAEAPFDVECGALQVRIADAQAGFNLNSIAVAGTTQARTRLQHVLGNLEVDPELADRALDWVDADEDSRGPGGEDADYLQREPAYRAANAPFVDESELDLLAEFTPEQRARLLAATVALPSPRSRINVNTAGAYAFLALAPNLSLADAQAIVESDRDFSDPAQFVTAHPQFGPAVDALAVTSEFFTVHARVDCGDATVHLASLLHRDPSNGRTRVLRRNFGRIWFNRGVEAGARSGTAGRSSAESS